MSESDHTPTARDGDDLRRRAHAIIDHLPLCELKAAILALEELEVSVQVRREVAERHATDAEASMG